MAQHYSIIYSDLRKYKSYKKLYDSFLRKAENGLFKIAHSLKFKEILSGDYKIVPTDRVFITCRTVNGREELFELHYNTDKEKIIDVLLVS